MTKRRRRLLQHDWNSRIVTVAERENYGRNFESIFGKATPQKGRKGTITIPRNRI